MILLHAFLKKKNYDIEDIRTHEHVAFFSKGRKQKIPIM